MSAGDFDPMHLVHESAESEEDVVQVPGSSHVDKNDLNGPMNNYGWKDPFPRSYLLPSLAHNAH